MNHHIDGDNTNPCVTITVRIGRQEHTREFTRELVRNPDGDYWEIGADCCQWLKSIGVDNDNIERITWDAEHVAWDPDNVG